MQLTTLCACLVIAGLLWDGVPPLTPRVSGPSRPAFDMAYRPRVSRPNEHAYTRLLLASNEGFPSATVTAGSRFLAVAHRNAVHGEDWGAPAAY
ncbi:uncharacterized protein BDR25DRAFT_308145 [Lindgomyces ingoldianus]|uniref:Uncharacterized protein n=1 Tax=Lindgomyces ingoldianus TaxID=673940 RepID=A0ACB6Q7E4_9PLEO|nr:uncharacterized protein BDR25DRAFT_308145 [Lindgomyces ingoldianus]KAF2462766.1 hypothetical protein BDR25DRAFT_308145 [Lindgomyces ingoldianus]